MNIFIKILKKKRIKKNFDKIKIAASKVEYKDDDVKINIILGDARETIKKLDKKFASSSKIGIDKRLDFDVDFNTELYRVIIHGILHYCGFKDKTEDDAKLMPTQYRAYRPK